MLCPACQGCGWLPAVDCRGPRPCEECGQMGVTGCCTGECQQPEQDVWQEWWMLGGEG